VIPQYFPMIPTLFREPFHRTGVNHAKRFPGVAAAIAALPVPTLVLDGEVAIFDEQLRSRFAWLRRHEPELLGTPPLLMAFDVLYRDGEDLTGRPLRERRHVLEAVIAGSAAVLPTRRLAADGLEAWAQVLARGYEGLVAKDDASPYRGGVTRSRLKVKVPGWTDSEDRWKRRLTGP